MTPDDWQQLTSRSTLLSVGVSLCFVSLMLNGFVKSNRRTLALRKQHHLHVRKPDEPNRTENTPQTLSHWEKHLPRYTKGVLITGLAITCISFFRN